jgi:hypothetical protein
VATDAAKLTWTNATQNTDGTPIPATGDKALGSVRIQRSVVSTCDAAAGPFGTPAEVLNIAVPATTATFANLTPAGKHCFRAASVLVDGTLGPWSAVLTKLIVIPPPPTPPKAKPPTITIE